MVVTNVILILLGLKRKLRKRNKEEKGRERERLKLGGTLKAVRCEIPSDKYVT